MRHSPSDRHRRARPGPRRWAALLACASTATAWAQEADMLLHAAGVTSAERRESPQIDQIGATRAYALGASGQGVVIAVLDTGLNTRHREFTGRLLAGINKSGVGSSTDVTDRHGHGTHVAGLVAAAADGVRMFGVAYGARLLPAKVLRDDGSGSSTMMDAALRAVAGRAAIANLSLSSPAAGSPVALRQALDKGLLVVAAAGNDGLAHPGWPARFAKEAWAGNRLIAVGAVDARNRIADFSNRAGDTAAWYLVAPGVGLLSTGLGSSYARMSGTSMAAPQVSGAAALVKSRWSYLRADQIANVLFITATDLGAPGIDAVYGRGLLNVEAAMQPVGNLTTVTWSGRRVKAIDTSVAPTPAVGGLWAVALRGGLQMRAYDDLQRDFGIDLGATVARPAPLSLASALDSAQAQASQVERALPGGQRLRVLQAQRLRPAGQGPEAAPATPDQRLLAFEWQRADAAGPAWAAGWGTAERHFGPTGLAAGVSLQGEPALASPLLGLMPHAAYAAGAWPLGGLRASAAVLGTGLNAAGAAQWSTPGAAPMQAAAQAPLRAQGAAVELSSRLGALDLSLGWVGAAEDGSFLGTRARGALALADTARSRGVQASLAWAPSAHWAAGAQWSRARTGGFGDADSVIAGLSAQHTEGFGLALVGTDQWRAGDRLSASLSQPLRARAGTAVIDRFTAVDAQGGPLRQREVVSLVPEGRERLWTLAYRQPLPTPGWGAGGIAHLKWMLAYRRDPGHQTRLPDEHAALLRLAVAW